MLFGFAIELTPCTIVMPIGKVTTGSAPVESESYQRSN